VAIATLPAEERQTRKDVLAAALPGNPKVGQHGYYSVVFDRLLNAKLIERSKQLGCYVLTDLGYRYCKEKDLI